MTQYDIIRMARVAKLAYGSDDRPLESVKHFAELVAAAAKEECAKLMDEMDKQDTHSNYYKVAAKAIRARGNT